MFAITSGLIKASILLFYRRLSPRSVSPTFRWILIISIAFIGLATLGFVFITVFTCDPISAFWDQTDLILNSSGKYKYKCLDEGAAIVANGAISALQDMIAATLPALLCWRLPLSPKQRKALYIIFTFSYSAVAFGCMRTYCSFRVFFETYDITWVAGDIWLWSLLELSIGCICANAPAVKIFYRHYFVFSDPNKLVETSSNSWDKISGSKRVTLQRKRADTSESYSSQMGINAKLEEDGGDIEMDHIQATTQFSFVITPAEEQKDHAGM
ncbi:hypothetical protein SNOG_08249 [Parastagonospora nodorum SN15]|nr:hypothetical protein SNOG_08249 [Parastagonospora nodorum SN15]EAT84525.2 hypothetical protein SNOG_08249 [Parastagonospora nodorum SN15]